jgi:hypothetical protein
MKKFEEYNIKYKHLARTDAMEERHIREFASTLTAWTRNVVVQPQQSEVQYAVYEAPDHEEWQKFRCSLKGQSTRMKLARLHLYLEKCKADAGSIAEMRLAQVRVDNYLGALIRGGQLNTTLHVSR